MKARIGDTVLFHYPEGYRDEEGMVYGAVGRVHPALVNRPWPEPYAGLLDLTVFPDCAAPQRWRGVPPEASAPPGAARWTRRPES